MNSSKEKQKSVNEKESSENIQSEAQKSAFHYLFDEKETQVDPYEYLGKNRRKPGTILDEAEWTAKLEEDGDGILEQLRNRVSKYQEEPEKGASEKTKKAKPAEAKKPEAAAEKTVVPSEGKVRTRSDFMDKVKAKVAELNENAEPAESARTNREEPMERSDFKSRVMARVAELQEAANGEKNAPTQPKPTEKAPAEAPRKVEAAEPKKAPASATKTEPKKAPEKANAPKKASSANGANKNQKKNPPKQAAKNAPKKAQNHQKPSNKSPQKPSGKKAQASKAHKTQSKAKAAPMVTFLQKVTAWLTKVKAKAAAIVSAVGRFVTEKFEIVKAKTLALVGKIKAKLAEAKENAKPTAGNAQTAEPSEKPLADADSLEDVAADIADTFAQKEPVQAQPKEAAVEATHTAEPVSLAKTEKPKKTAQSAAFAKGKSVLVSKIEAEAAASTVEIEPKQVLAEAMAFAEKTNSSENAVVDIPAAFTEEKFLTPEGAAQSKAAEPTAETVHEEKSTQAAEPTQATETATFAEKKAAWIGKFKTKLAAAKEAVKSAVEAANIPESEPKQMTETVPVAEEKAAETDTVEAENAAVPEPKQVTEMPLAADADSLDDVAEDIASTFGQEKCLTPEELTSVQVDGPTAEAAPVAESEEAEPTETVQSATVAEPTVESVSVAEEKAAETDTAETENTVGSEQEQATEKPLADVMPLAADADSLDDVAEDIANTFAQEQFILQKKPAKEQSKTAESNDAPKEKRKVRLNPVSTYGMFGREAELRRADKRPVSEVFSGAQTRLEQPAEAAQTVQTEQPEQTQPTAEAKPSVLQTAWRKIAGWLIVSETAKPQKEKTSAEEPEAEAPAEPQRPVRTEEEWILEFRRELGRKRKKLLVYIGIGILISLPMLILMLVSEASPNAALSQSRNPALYAGIQLALLALYAGFTLPCWLEEPRRFIRRKGDAGSDTVQLVAIFACLIQTVALMSQAAKGGKNAVPILAPICAIAMTVNLIGKYQNVSRVRRNLAWIRKKMVYGVSAEGEKNAYDTVLHSKREMEHYAEMAMHPDFSVRRIAKMTPGILTAAAILTMVACFISFDFVQPVTVFTACLCVACPFSTMVAIASPLAQSCAKLRRRGAMLSAWDSANRLGDVDRITLRDCDIFPPEFTVLRQIKIFGNGRVEEIVPEAEALMRKTGSPVCTVLKNTIHDGKYLPDAESVEYENGGVVGWVSGKRVMLGGRSLLERHGIDLPTKAYEQEHYPAGQNALYFVESGELMAVLLMEYATTLEIDSQIRLLASVSCEIQVRSNDGSVTEEMLCKRFGLPPESVTVCRGAEMLAENVSEEPIVPPAGIVRNGLPLLRLISEAVRLKQKGLLAVLLESVGILIGLIFIAVFGLIGAITKLTATEFLVFQLFWMLATMLIPKIRTV